METNVVRFESAAAPEKKCSKCGKMLPATLEYFAPHLTCRFGVTSRCRECERQRVKHRHDSLLDHSRTVQDSQPSPVRKAIALASMGALTWDELAKQTGYSTNASVSRTHCTLGNFMDKCRLIPWLTVIRTSLVGRGLDEATYRFVVDGELKAVCEHKLPATDLLKNRLGALREEIKRIRKEANDTTAARNWNVDRVHTAKQSQLLDRIEEELEKLSN